MLLRNKDRKLLTDIFSTSPVAIEVWAHGSRVTGEAHEGSDLDLVVRTHDLQKLPIDVYASLKEKIKHSNIPILVQLIDWARIPDTFHQNILNDYEVLYSNLKEASHT